MKLALYAKIFDHRMLRLTNQNQVFQKAFDRTAKLDQFPPSRRHASHYVCRTKAQLRSFMMTKYFLYKVLIRFGHKLCALSSMKVFIFQFYRFLPSKVLE